MTGISNPSDPQPSFVLEKLSQVFHIFRRYWQAQVSPVGVTVPQFNALAKLDLYGELNPSQLAQLLYSDRPTISVIVRNLVKRGWAETVRNESNRKFVIVRITESGAAKLGEVRESASYSSIGFHPLGCFSGEELKDLEAHLDKLIEHLQTLPAVAADTTGEPSTAPD